MSYDYEAIIDDYRQKYNQLAIDASQGSLEQHTYQQIVRFIDDTAQVEPPIQRAFELAIQLSSLSRAVPEPEAISIIRQCANNFIRDTGQQNSMVHF